MGEGIPYPHPVQFDKGLAQAAITMLEDAVMNLDQFTQGDVAMAGVALQNWKGKYADDYSSHDLPWIKREAGNVKTEFQTWIRKIKQAIDDAARLQRVHDAANAQWRRDHPEGN